MESTDFQNSALSALEIDDSVPIDIWIVSTDVSAEERHALKELLSGDEIEYAQRFRFDLDRERYITSHGVLRKILSTYTGVSASAINFSVAANGKPSVAGVPPSIQFNLSHSGNVALVAVSSAHCGVDIEKIRRELSYMDIAERFFTADENRWLTSLPRSARLIKNRDAAIRWLTRFVGLPASA